MSEKFKPGIYRVRILADDEYMCAECDGTLFYAAGAPGFLERSEFEYVEYLAPLEPVTPIDKE